MRLMHLVRLVFLVVVGLFVHITQSQARIYILIDQPSEKKFPIAIESVPNGGRSVDAAKSMEALLRRDLQIAGYFELQPPSSYVSDPTASVFEESAIDFSIWQAIGSQALIKGNFKSNGKDITVQWYLYDVEQKKQLVGKEYSFREADSYQAVHKFANEVILALTGSRGIFETQIVAACGPNGGRQIVTMYPDGTGKKSWTGKMNTLSPDWGPDMSKIAFTGFTSLKRGIKHPDLYLLDLGSGKAKPIFTRGSLSITPAFSPSGDSIAFTSTVSEDAEIYLIDLKGDLLGRITNSYSIDEGPTWSPDGSQLIFASERAGRLHLFKGGRSGGASRLTFVGYQNDQADWAPTGDKVAFTSRDQGRFDIFIMNPDGSKIQRLTHQEGDNESPSWSPDGRYVVFSSTRSGHSALYVMSWDGDNPQMIDTSTCVNPDWSGWESGTDKKGK